MPLPHRTRRTGPTGPTGSARPPWPARRATAAGVLAGLAGLMSGLLTAAPAQAAAPAESPASAKSAAPAASADHEACRPDGLYRTPGVEVPYCTVYDTEGREKMGADHQRRAIGYFTSWRTGKDGQQQRYLASDIPWDKITHINYAFAHVGSDNRISVGSDRPDNPAIGMTWPDVPGAEMDPAYAYKGHFNLLNKFKKQHPDVKTLVSVGGWAESGGYIDDSGQRLDQGGFYRMTTNADGSVNTAGINAFADSTVDFVKKYGFNGVDIDYEYATSMMDAGNPDDWPHANARRGGLMKSYAVLMKTLREKLDRASAADGKHYLLTVAAPASGWLLRGMETHQITQYLDYLDIMSYDLHGTWNEFVGPNAALYDDGKDAELKHWNVYNSPQYGGLGYLNTDWAAHYYRGSMPAGRINIGLPSYSRGWKNVTGGTNGLWGTAKAPTCTDEQCGDGAVGIDNIWHDKNSSGAEVPAGYNPMWHNKNLEKGIAGDYLPDYGFPADTKISGYTRHYDSTLKSPWLWNAEKKVFLSTEDEQSLGAKIDYVKEQGFGGTMMWELAGDYDWNATKGQYEPGDSMITQMYEGYKAASPYGAKKANRAMPTETLDIDVSLSGFPLGDSNYPISPKLTIKNNTKATLPGGTEFQFDYGTSAPGTMADQSGWGMRTVSSDHTGNNIGGLKGDFHRASLKLPGYQSLPPGASATIDVVYQLPVSTPSNWTVNLGGKTYALTGDLARGTTPGDPGGGDPGEPGECTAAPWNAGTVYTGGQQVSHQGHTWQAKWWTQGETPGTGGDSGVWKDLGAC